MKRLALALVLVSSTATAEEEGFQLKSVETALTAFEQRGVGYQSQASNTVLGPGSERLIVFEPQLLVRARQGERFEHTLLTTLDIVTAASPNAVDRLRKPDAISTASKTNQAGALDWTASYAFSPHVSGALRNGLHLEENFRSLWNGISASYSFAEDAATASASLQQIHDWFDRFDVTGVRVGRATRTTTSGNAGLTQILGPETVVHASYGLTTQTGELSNTWNSVPLNGYGEEREGELLPRRRIRHALVGRFAQWLPWTGALKGSYRFYADDWGTVAHTFEAQLLQRFSPLVYARASYRFHTQTAVDFFTTLATPETTLRTADSDLAAFDAHTIGGKVSVDVPSLFEGAHFDLGYERYFRTDHVRVNVVLWQAGARF